ncbi:MAG: TraR/DksA C4-type zinc finger protein [Rubrivivax sp.]
MPDLFDQAQEVEEMWREASIDQARWRTTTASARECELCGADIPEARRAALPGVSTCVDCAAELERRVRLKGPFK